MPDFPHEVDTDLRVAGDVWVKDGAKLGHRPYMVVRADTALERKHRGWLILCIAEAAITVTLPRMAEELDQSEYRIRHFGGTESVTLRGEGATKLDTTLDLIQIAPGGWYDCVAIFKLTTWALTGNDRVVTEAVAFIEAGETKTAKPGGFYSMDPFAGGTATLILPPTRETPGALVYVYIVDARPDRTCVIRCSGRDNMDGRFQDAEYRADSETEITSGRGWSFVLRSDGNGFWVIV